MDVLIRHWIVEVLEQHRPLLAIALRQRAKFEGWLKFELALYAEQHGATSVRVETPSDAGSRSDLSFIYGGRRYDCELKTCNTNWRMAGVENRHRPITRNIRGVIIDGGKMRDCPGNGIVAFCLFPVKYDDSRWQEYLDRVASGLAVDLCETRNTARVTVPLAVGAEADIIVSTFAVSKEARASSEHITGVVATR